jgi:2-oxopent-4-enoate/cis-2-oxohex-4-enoate hydratase
MNSALITRLGDQLYHAMRTQTTIEPFSKREPGIVVADSYAISRHVLARREQDGETVVGMKIGLTSRAGQKQLGVDRPDYGFLTDAMAFNSGSDVPISNQLIQPKAEGEIVFVLAEDLYGPNLTADDVIRATKGVTAGFEIADSRIVDWHNAYEDTVADNASCGLYVLSDKLIPIEGVDLVNCSMELTRNGEVESVAAGPGNTALGSPVNVVAWLANALGEYGAGLNAGDVVLSGALGPTVPAVVGDELSLIIGGIGEAFLRFV